MNSIRSTRSVGVAFALFLSFAVQAANTVDMHGFQVDFSHISDHDKKAMEKSLNAQFEIVEAANVPSKVLDFFRTVPVVIDPAMMNAKGNARYGEFAGRPTVILRPTKLPSGQPLILHELLHAYHHQVLKQPTPQVVKAYQHALQSGIYRRKYRDAHFLENGKEYFAVIASIYLFDQRIDQPPFDCSIPAKEQPEFIAFLAQQFGERQCK